MKKILSIAIVGSVLWSVVPFASAATIYTENWGSPNTAVTGNGNITTVGWTGIAVSQTAGPYLGIYSAAGPNDPTLGLGLPANTVYFTVFQTTNLPGMFYTTDTSGQGSGGNSSFTDINPTLYTNLTLNMEVRDPNGSNPATNYFAVRVGGQWYVATSYPLPEYTVMYPAFTNAALVYTNPANVWQTLTINGTTNVTIGAVASPNLTSLITGIGIVEINTPGGFNYNQLVINQGLGDFPRLPATNTVAAVSPQNVYVGGGASFLPSFAGSPNLVYQWQTNGTAIAGGRYLGTNTTQLTITNCNLNDAGSFYMVVVTNLLGKATNSGLQLIVSNVPDGMLYSETFPYLGPNGNLPLTGVGWVVAAPASTGVGIYSAGGGTGDAFSYSLTATTNCYYTTDTNDVGLSGLPFVDINPASYPYVTLQAGFVPGNQAGQTNGNISVYWAVKTTGGWYCSAQPQLIDLSAQGTYKTYQYGYDPAATNWNNLTITSSSAVIGGQAAGALSGNIIGAGLVIAHNTGAGASMNFQNFEIITNQAIGTPPDIGLNYPLAVTVASGGGASFGVSAAGSPPTGYGWSTNGVYVTDGGRISGSSTPTLTIANLNANDNNLSIVAYVTNTAGNDYSSKTYGATVLTVTNPSVGIVYEEAPPFVGPVAGNYPISSIGWVEAVPNAPNALFQAGIAQTAGASQGAISASFGSMGTTVYYATTATDTNQSGLPFPNVDLAAYTNLSFSVEIAPDSATSTNVAAYLGVQIGTNWYVSTSAFLGPNAASNSVYTTYTMPFNPAAANWDNLTVTSSGGLIGSTAASNLKGVMTGAGLVFVTVGSGGVFNFQNFIIKGTGVGGIVEGPLSGGNVNLSWVGNPAVKLQSSTNLSNSANWQDVPNTYGLYSLPVSATGPQTFFRLKSP
jgi:hypothetical protein